MRAFRFVLSLAVPALLFVVLIQLPVHAGCAEPAGEPASVVRVIDGETLVLGGGTQVRLTGALVPRAYDTAAGASTWPPEVSSKAELEGLVLGRSIQLRSAQNRRTDRYGRVLAQAYVTAPDNAVIWVQGEMVRRGAARAATPIGNEQCLIELLALERTAREGGVGLWSAAAYAVRSANDTAALLRVEGTYQIVEGRVHAVAKRRTTAYVNFAMDWRRDFTIAARGRTLRRLKTAGLELAALTGRRIRVRGWIVRRGGPLIEIGEAHEIELLDQSEVAPVQMPAR